MAEKPKALILSSVASMIDQFNMHNIRLLLSGGYAVDVACNCKIGNTISDERVKKMTDTLNQMGVEVIHVPIPRKISDLGGVRKSLKQVKALCEAEKYTLLHCHSPIGSVVARLAASHSRKKYGTKVIYTAHGFHFYKGAPKQNWLVFYPIEKLMAHKTDVLVTINKEDYAFAQKHMKTPQIEYVPGVGVNTAKFHITDFDKATKKAELGLNPDDIMILSVGELNQNKNQEVVVKAISKLDNPHVHYIIAGKGDKEQYLTDLAAELNVNLHLLGYRTDITELLNTADIFAFSSFREGLSVALMEAMATGLPCVVSKIRGNVDLIDERGGFLCDPNSEDEFFYALSYLICGNKKEEFGRHNMNVMQGFDVHTVMRRMAEIYGIRIKAVN